MLRALILCLAVTLPTGAFARPDEALRAKVRERVRTMRTAKLIELLDLDEATAARLFPVLNRYDEQLEPIVRDMGEARREMRAQIESGKPDVAKLNKLVDRVVAGREKMHKVENDRLRDVRKVLTPVQMAKIVIVLPEVDRFVHKEIRKALKRGGPGASSPFGDD
jgi:Spy/CpxP family protein refolding chaperone